MYAHARARHAVVRRFRHAEAQIGDDAGMRPAPVLPILERRAEIESAIARHQVVVICGETGSGKTTQLPQIVLHMGLDRAGVIGHTQPRRLAARAVADRIAFELGGAVGGIVGAKVRFQDRTSRATRIKLMTDGILLAEMSGDPRLSEYGIIIIDEAHERSLNIDFLLGALQRLLPQRHELKLIITSATIDPRRFSDAFGGPTLAPVIEVSGRTYPVEVRYHPSEGEAPEPSEVADAVQELLGPRAPEGDVLVFLPGEREIRQSADALRRAGVEAEILPLFSRLSNQEQDRIFRPGASRRVILATNVAETSLTVPGIRHVVDTGLARLSRYDPQRKIQRLPIEPISRASANQRSGRCGRTADGVCIRLYSEASYRERPAFTEPEVRRSSLAGVILRMMSLDIGPIERFPFIDAPETAAIDDGYHTLFELGAIDNPGPEGRITEIGRRIAAFPVDPRIARMLLAGEREGALREVLILGAALSIQDPRERPMGKQEEADRAQIVFRHEQSDFLTLLRLWDQHHHAAATMGEGGRFSWCREHFVSPVRMREWGETHAQLREIADQMGLRADHAPASDDAVHRALLTGLISHVACREGVAGSFDYRGIRGNTLSIFPGSVLFKRAPKWIIAAEVVQTSRLFARTVGRVEPEWVEELAGHVFQRQIMDPHLDRETGEPSAWERLSMSGVVVVPRRRAQLAAIDPARARAVFILDGLVRGGWSGQSTFLRHCRVAMEQAQVAEARLRRRGVRVSDEALAAWFGTRLPAAVCDPASFEHWAAAMGEESAAALALKVDDAVIPEGRRAFDALLFPDVLRVGEEHDSIALPIAYALAPGKDEDGVTISVPLAALPLISTDRVEWLVPGLLPDVVLALLKSGPKASRAALESAGSLAEIAASCAEVMEFARGSLIAALSEAVEALHGVRVSPQQWPMKSIPDHLRLRARVIDESGKELGADRDISALHERFAGRIEKLRTARVRSRFERVGVTAWDFGELPGAVEAPGGDAGERAMIPAIIDGGRSVALRLIADPSEAAALTPLGVRRLFAIACREEVSVYLTSFPGWSDATRHYAALGSAEDLLDALVCHTAERVFLMGKPPVRTREEFDERSREQWGRLAAGAREVAEVASRLLEPRAKVAQRISGGTPRLWAESIADLREQAAYLMPSGFLHRLSWERLREYPRYSAGMRARLLALREDGSGAEKESLRAFLPHWKKFTGWVAAAMAAERKSAGAAGENGGSDERGEGLAARGAARASAPLPKARRAAPTVNVNAGEWAMRPGRLPKAVEAYRWAVEELRLALFAPEFAAKPGITVGQVEQAARTLPPA